MASTGLERLQQPDFQKFTEAPQIEVLGHFIALRADTYLRHYGKLRHDKTQSTATTRAQRLPFAVSWLWPAFAVTVPWMFYRKMYTGGIILVTLPVFLDHLLPDSLFLGSGLLVAIIAGLCGKSWYLEHAANRLAKAHRLHATRTAQAAYLRRASGVSLAAGIFGGLIQLVTAVVIVLDLLPPNRF